ncbi:MAG: hypothetical protein B7Y56_03115 [Gallionellales bacterium 35-53-114]|jgi:hypothetical protein|nr:MAG: hypothetical protein B7Y56_03115 [Gallionellales bacterium 35-53-114]OYZ65098.1 MAG: hypothetical protein B7Y04_00275 [Gallionellales bacterium 24-53-125]OZB08007.1 MAG: hypothetical protein B7X61_10725 [Gallionellales bacterium 39-52-133]
MIRAFPGGWEAMAAAMGFSKDALENRIYERKGQTLTVHQAEQMQAFSGTSLFAEGVARDTGGVFIKLPAAREIGNDELLSEFNLLYAKLGELSATFREAVKDNDIDKAEKADLDAIGQEIHCTVQELLALTYSVYCKQADA